MLFSSLPPLLAPLAKHVTQPSLLMDVPLAQPDAKPQLIMLIQKRTHVSQVLPVPVPLHAVPLDKNACGPPTPVAELDSPVPPTQQIRTHASQLVLAELTQSHAQILMLHAMSLRPMDPHAPSVSPDAKLPQPPVLESALIPKLVALELVMHKLNALDQLHPQHATQMLQLLDVLLICIASKLAHQLWSRHVLPKRYATLPQLARLSRLSAVPPPSLPLQSLFWLLPLPCDR